MPPDQGLCPWTSLGALPSDPLIRSRSALAMCPRHFQIASAAAGPGLVTPTRPTEGFDVVGDDDDDDIVSARRRRRTDGT